MSECIFFTSSNCWKISLDLASANTLWTSGECVACTNAMLLQYNPAPIKALSNKSVLMSGSRPQYLNMV
jgi:hypothetical protein